MLLTSQDGMMRLVYGNVMMMMVQDIGSGIYAVAAQGLGSPVYVMGVYSSKDAAWRQAEGAASAAEGGRKEYRFMRDAVAERTLAESGGVSVYEHDVLEDTRNGAQEEDDFMGAAEGSWLHDAAVFVGGLVMGLVLSAIMALV